MSRAAIAAALAVTALALPTAAHASSPAPAAADDLAARFGALEDVAQVSLSPDGRRFAAIMPLPGGGQLIGVADVGGEAMTPIYRGNPGDHLEACRWTTDTRLACRVSAVFTNDGLLVGVSRWYAIDADGKHLAELSAEQRGNVLGYRQSGGSVVDWAPAGEPGHVLMAQDYLGGVDTGTYLRTRNPGLGLDDVDTVTMRHKPLLVPNASTAEFMTDGHGTLRVKGLAPLNDAGPSIARINYVYRGAEGGAWKPLSTLVINDEAKGFEPVAVDPAKNVVYGFDDKDGRKALYAIALDGSLRKDVVLARPDVDVDELIRIGPERRVIGVSYATEKRTIQFFDPALGRLAGELGRALPGHPAVGWVDASADGNRLLLFASSDVDPGSFHVYDRTTRHLDELLPVRSRLAGVTLARQVPVSYRAADGTTIPAYLTLPPGSTGKAVAAIVMPHGGPSARDEWGFDWLVQFFAVRGYAVLQPNYRGSSGYGAEFYKKNGFRSWKTAIGDVDDAGRWLVSQGIAAPGKLAIVGWSYGGYAALQSGVLDPGLFKAIVAVAPVTDLETLRHQFDRFANKDVEDAFIGHGPHVAEGSPAQNAARITAPVLLFHGDRDQNVDIAESRLMAARLRAAGKSVELVEFPGLDHQLPSTAARTRVLAGSDAFLRKALALP